MNLLINTTVSSDLSAEPVSLVQAKAWIKVAHTDDDTLITDLITAARIWLENYTGLSLAAKTLVSTVEMCEDEPWKIIGGPLTAITQVRYKRTASDDYEVLTTSEYALIVDLFDAFYAGIYELTYTCGFTTLAKDLQTDLKKLIAYQYQNRGINLSNENTSLADFPRLNAEYYRRVVI